MQRDNSGDDQVCGEISSLCVCDEQRGDHLRCMVDVSMEDCAKDIVKCKCIDLVKRLLLS